MAYKKNELEALALAAIQENDLVFIDDVVTFLPCSEATFYNHKLEQLDSIKSAIHANKVSKKIGLREKMYNAENPTAWVALYKLIGTDEEAERLNGSKQKHELTGKDGGAIQQKFVVEVVNGNGNQDK